MPRQQRQLFPNSYYHIMIRGNNSHVVFLNDEDYKYFLSLLKKYKEEHPFDLFHYCLMSNHVHMLVRIKEDSYFSTFMKRLNLSYFYHYRNNYGWIGYFWQDRFKSQQVEKDEHFIQSGKYIELNPVRAGIVNTPDKYIYSSFNHYAGGKLDPLITNDFVYEDLAPTSIERQKAYQKLIIDEIIALDYIKNTYGGSKQNCLKK